MSAVTDATDRASVAGSGADANRRLDAAGCTVATVVLGLLLAVATRSGALELLIVTGFVQALLAFGYVFGLAVSGWLGALVLAGLAAGAADAVTSAWPHARLGVLLAVAGLAVPTMFVHQLWRGAARAQVLDSLGGIALLVLAEVALPALAQARHDFREAGSDVALAIIAISCGGLFVGLLLEMIVTVPHWDANAARGLPGVLGSAVAGAVLGVAVLRGSPQIGGGAALLAGAGLGALVALLAIGVGYLTSTAPSVAGDRSRLRPWLDVVVPVCLAAPVGFLVFSALT